MSERTVFAWRIVALGAIALVLFIVALIPLAARAQIPAGAEKYKRDLIRNARLEWGLDAPIATFAGQIATESAWRESAKSSAGALGLSQFVPKTATWLSGLYDSLGPAEPLNPIWAMRAMSRYDKHLFDRMPKSTRCHQGAFMLSAYNGGELYLNRAIAACDLRDDCDDSLWWENVERIDDGRSVPNWVENRAYPAKVMFLEEPKYVKAGWGRGLCQGEAY